MIDSMVEISHGLLEAFPTNKGLHQGCPITCLLFKTYTEEQKILEASA